jgi:hypothetical protein
MQVPPFLPDLFIGKVPELGLSLLLFFLHSPSLGDLSLPAHMTSPSEINEYFELYMLK